jgi:hypothetical protein
MLSSDSDLDLLGRLINKAGFRTRLAYARSFYIESMILFELRDSALYSSGLSYFPPELTSAAIWQEKQRGDINPRPAL